MKRLLQILAACAVGAMLALPASAATYDEGGFRWSYYYDEDEEDGCFVAYIGGVVQLDAAGNPKAWDAASLAIPATLPVPPEETNEYARAEFDSSGNPVSYTTVRGPTVKSGVATVTSFYAGLSATDALTSVTIPETVEYVSGFAGCKNLATVTISDDTTYTRYSFADTPWLKAQGDFVIRDGTLVAYQGTATEVTVPDGVKEIGVSAFDSYYNPAVKTITSITLPSGLVGIGDCAFYGCEKLAAINIPDTVRFIDDAAFEYCYELTSVTVPSKVKYLADEVFAGCSKLSSVALPEGLRAIDDSAFGGCTSLAAINIPASVESIDYGAFAGCTSLAAISIPASVESIGYSAFYGCTSLAAINVPASVKYIYSEAFYGCTALATVTGCDGIEYIDSDAFYNTPLWDVTDGIVMAGSVVLGYNGTLPASLAIPEGVTYILDSAFAYNGDVTALTLPSTLKKIGSSAFANSAVETVTGGAGVVFVGYRPFDSTVYGNTFWDDRGDAGKPFELMRLGNLVLGYRGVCPAEIVIPDDVTELATSLFDRDYDTSVDNITSVVVGSGVKRIGEFAFYRNTNLKTVVGGASLEYIDWEAFEVCKKLESVTLGGKLDYLGGYIFLGCESLQRVELTGVYIVLHQGMFDGCANLASLTINLLEPEDSEDEEWGVSVKSGTFATCPNFAGVAVKRAGYELVGWSDNYGEEFADELATFSIFRKNSGWYGDDDYHSIDFHPLWKRVLRNVEGDAPFTTDVATTYAGWISDSDGNLAGSVTLKVSKGKKGATTSKATATVVVLGGKKVTLKGTIDANGNGQEGLSGLVLTANGLSGSLAVNGIAYAADGARDVMKTSKDPAQNLLKPLDKKVWTLVFAPDADKATSAFANGFAGLSLSIGTKGKAKLTGTMPDGNKINVSSQVVVGDYNCCIPVVYSKNKGSFGFIAWIDNNGAPLAITAVSDWKGKPSGAAEFTAEMDLVDFEELRPIAESTSLSVDAEDLPASLVGVQAQFLPVAEPVAVEPRKWTLAKAASIKYKKGVFDQAAYDKGVAQGKTNNSALKLKYTAKSGLFSGSFSIFTLNGATLKKETPKIYGVVCNGIGYGAAVIKKHGTMPVVIGEIEDDEY